MKIKLQCTISYDVNWCKHYLHHSASFQILNFLTCSACTTVQQNAHNDFFEKKTYLKCKLMLIAQSNNFWWTIACTSRQRLVVALLLFNSESLLVTVLMLENRVVWISLF